MRSFISFGLAENVKLLLAWKSRPHPILHARTVAWGQGYPDHEAKRPWRLAQLKFHFSGKRVEHDLQTRVRCSLAWAAVARGLQSRVVCSLARAVGSLSDHADLPQSSQCVER